MNSWLCAAAATLALATATSSLSAQVFAEPPTPTPTGPEGVPVILRSAAGTVALGMGNVGMFSTDADAIFYNVGMLTQVRGVSLSGQRYGTGANTAAIASVQALGSTSIGFGARVLNGRWPMPRFPVGLLSWPNATSVIASYTAAPTTAVALTGAAARSLGPVRLGLGATYVRESFAADFDDALLIDAGVVYPLGPMSAALSVQHMGESLNLFLREGASPWRAVLGFGGANYPIATFFDVSAFSQVSVDESGDVLPAIGSELTYVPLEGVSFAARVGVRRPAFSNEAAVTAGVGFTLDRYSLDYAFEPFIGLPDAHRIGLRIR